MASTLYWSTSKSTSVRGIKRNIMRNELFRANRKIHHGQYISEQERLRTNEKRKGNFIKRGQSFFGAIFSSQKAPKEDTARKSQAR